MNGIMKLLLIYSHSSGIGAALTLKSYKPLLSKDKQHNVTLNMQ